MDLSWHGLNCELEVKTLSHWKARIWLPWLSKKFQTHPPRPTEIKPSFRKVSLHPAKLHVFPLLTSGLESFGHKSTPSNKPWIGPKLGGA